MQLVLIADNDEFARGLIDVLEAEGHRATWCRHEAVPFLGQLGADAVLIELDRPDRTDLSTLVGLRRIGATPLVALATNADPHMLEQVRWAVDECLTDPVRPGELLELVDRVVHRTAVRARRVVNALDVTVNLEAGSVWVAGRRVLLTAKEYQVLAVLANQAGRPVSRRSIERAVWGASLPSSSRSLDVHMTTLRAKLNRPSLIQTVHGFGYRFGEPAGAPKVPCAPVS